MQNDQHVLGETFSWDGTARQTNFAEMDSKYNRIGDNFLLRRLMSTSSSSASGTMLEPLKNSNDVSSLKDLSKALATALSNLRLSAEQIGDLEMKITNLRCNLTGQQPKEDVVGEDTRVADILSNVGMNKELAHCSDKVKVVRSYCDENRQKSLEIANSMRENGLLRGSGYAGAVSSGVDFLHQRDLGVIGGATTGDFGAFSQGGVGACNGALTLGSSRVLGTATGAYKMLWRINAHCLNPAYCVIVDKTGEYAITGADDFLVKVWHIPTGRLVNTLRGHQSYISMLAVSPDNSLIVSACTYGYIRVWLFRTGRCVAVLKHAQGAVNWLKFDETSLCLVTAGEEGQCMVWDLSQFLLESPAAWSAGARGSSGESQAGGSSQDQSQSSDSLVSISAADSGAVSGAPTADLVDRADCQYRDGTIPLLDILQAEGRTVYNRHQQKRDMASKEEVDVLGFGEFNAASADAAEDSSVVAPPTPDRITGAGSSCCLHAPYEAAFITCPWKQRSALSVSFGNSVSSSRGSYADFIAAARSSIAGSFALSLPHVSDGSSRSRPSAARGEDVDGSSVYCLDTSPLGDYVVTGCEDGVARLWRISSEAPAEAGSSSRSSGGNSANLAALEQLRGEIPHDEWLSLETVAKHLVFRLEGHSCGVTDTKFSNRGDKVVTGSCKEGAIRIWVFSKHYCKATYLAIDLDTNVISYSSSGSAGKAGDGADNSNSNIPASYHSRRINKGPAKVAANKPQLYNVHWTCDDMFVVTIQSAPDVRLTSRGSAANANPGGSRAKVFNSSTGAIMHTFLVSYDRVDLLAMHPSSPSVVCTAGMDGILRVWDTSKMLYDGSRGLDCVADTRGDADGDQGYCDLTHDGLPYPPMYSYAMVCPPDVGEIPEGSPIRIVDVTFSCDCYHIICTDFIGRVSLFGLECTDVGAYANVFSEQYYSSDYADIMLDEDGWAIDVRTQLPVHLVRDSYLCRLNGSAYSTAATSDDNVGVGSGHLITSGACPPVPLPVHAVKAILEEIRGGRSNAFKTMEKSYHHQHKKNKVMREKVAFTTNAGVNASLAGRSDQAQRGPNQRSSGRPPSSPGRSQRSSQRYEESELYGGQNSGSYDESKYDYLLEDGDDLYPDGGSRYRVNSYGSRTRSNGEAGSPARRSGRSSTIMTMSSRLAAGVGTLRRSSASRSQSSNRNGSGSRSTRRTITDEDDDEDEYQETAASRHRRRQLSDEESFASFSGESEGDGNGHSSSDSGSGGCGSSTSDSEGGARSSSQRSSRGHSSKSRRHKKRGHSRKHSRRHSHSENEEEGEEFMELIEVKKPRKPRYIPWSKRPSVNPDGGKVTDVVPIGVQVDRKWLLEDSPPPPMQYTGAQQYCPQVGDAVFYFPQGHMDYLERFGGTPPWLANSLFASHPAVVECEVSSMSYHFPTEEEYSVSSSIVATIVMRITGLPLPVPSSSGQFIPTQFTVPRLTRHTTSQAANNPHGQNVIVVSVRCCGLPDFIIPDHVYHRAARMNWRIGMRVSGWFCDETPSPPENLELALSQPEETSSKEVLNMYYGTVVNISDCSVDSVAAHDRRKSSAIQWRNSPWDCMQVLWDDSAPSADADASAEASIAPEGARICPWEITPCNDSNSSSVEGTPLSSPQQARLASTPLEFARVPDVAHEELLRVLDQCMGTDSSAAAVSATDIPDEPEIDEELEYTRPFWYNVDSETYIEYYSVIPLPMCLDLIRRRLVRRYYHSVAAVVADINLLHHNCALYNEDGAEIVESAQALVQLLVGTVLVYMETVAQNPQPIAAIVSRSSALLSPQGVVSRSSALLSPQGVVSSSSSGGVDRLGRRSTRNTPSPTMASTGTQRASRSNANSGAIAAMQSSSSSSSNSTTLRSRRATGTESSVPAVSSASAPSISSGADRRRARGAAVEESEEEDMAIEESEEESGSRKRRRSSGRKGAVDPDGSTGGRIKRRVSYQEPESEEDEEEEEEEEEESQPRRRGRSMADRMADKMTLAARSTSSSGNSISSGAAPKRLSPELKKEMLQLITLMTAEDEGNMGLFQDEVTEGIAPGYFDIISNPIDLSTIR